MLVVAGCVDGGEGTSFDARLPTDAVFVDGRLQLPADARAQLDARVLDARTADASAATGYRRTVIIDGTNDFVPEENRILTTTTGYEAFVSWDEDALFFGHAGDDLQEALATKLLLVYIDVDPGTTNGAPIGETVENQTPDFPAGFEADFVWRFRLDGAATQLRENLGPGQWQPVAQSGVSSSRVGRFVEARIPWSTLGDARPPAVGIVSLFVNTDFLEERAYAGLYPGSFADGFYPEIPIGFFLRAEPGSESFPSAAANRRP